VKSRTFIIGCALAIAVFLFAQHRNAASNPAPFTHVIDLTHSISEQTPNWEGTAESPFHAKQLGDIDKNGYFSREITLPEHFGTHIDAPAHFMKGAWTVDQIPPERLVAPLIVLDVAGKCASNPDYQITVDDVAEWERANGQIPPGAVVIARTGWSSRWNSMKEYRNADAKDVRHFPGYLPDTARFLVESRKIYGLGIDTMSVDYGPSTDFPVHQYTSKHDVYHLENVGDLSRVPLTGAMLVVGAAKLKGGSGGPVRLLALVK
jgi:kynurenine formamidase